jgi:hypothetical protein
MAACPLFTFPLWIPATPYLTQKIEAKLTSSPVLAPAAVHSPHHSRLVVRLVAGGSSSAGSAQKDTICHQRPGTSIGRSAPSRHHQLRIALTGYGGL